MKLYTYNSNIYYKPIEFTIILETIEEAQEFRNIFNTSEILACLSHIRGSEIRNELDSKVNLKQDRLLL